MRIQIQDMQPSHWPDVRQIYEQGLAGGNATFETQLPTWEEWDQGHLSTCRLVAGYEKEVAGWAALSRVSQRAVYHGVAEVSVYVAHMMRSMGVGKALLERLVACSEENGIWTLQSSMFPENEASISLHRSCGFRIVGRREKIAQHHGVWRDTLLLERRSQLN